MASPAYTLILDSSAHLDWDWLRSFAELFWYPYYSNNRGANDVIGSGLDQVQNDPTHKYYYTVCEMGFLRRFVETHPDQIGIINQLGNNFQVISGGVTSADCLVCSGEGFIRNYLIGQTWLKKGLGMSPKPHCWLPDDFGQGPELPVLLSALGFSSVAFSRLPGTQPNHLKTELQDELVKEGLDFKWQASDGSQVFAHFMINGYGFGNNLTSDSMTPVEAMQEFVQAYGPSKASPPTYTAAKTSYMYIPIDDDFHMPIDYQDMTSYIKEWNSGYQSSTNVRFIQGTFDTLVTALQKDADVLVTRAYNGTPYWTGYYASRPELKSLHYDTVRALTAAEVVGLLTLPSDPTKKSLLPIDFWTRIDQAWTDFAPSTHHDYICGTATDPVYVNDQLPLLRGAAAAAGSLRGAAMNALAGMIGTGVVIVSNSLGFARSGVAKIEGIRPCASTLTWLKDPETTTTTQVTVDGGMLVYASVPSFGYIVGSGDNSSSNGMDSAKITPGSSGEESYTMSNEYLTATITQAASWGLSSLKDSKNNHVEVLAAGSEGVGNVITFYDDSNGDIYQFGNEYKTMDVIENVSVITTGIGLGPIVLETGPIQARLRTEVLCQFQFQGKQVEQRFVREYELRAGEPFLRMTTTGAAPANTSVMATFPLASVAKELVHGTAYHWTNVQPLSDYWKPPIFQATHDFLIPQDSGHNQLAAFYHSAMPAWAIDANGVLMGCLFRNTPGNDNGHGASGSDTGTHTQQYALRVPSGLGSPATGQPLREAQGFNTPLLAALLPGSGNEYPGMITATVGSLAAPPSDGAAILTVAKPGNYDPSELILRLYQPTNQAQNVQITLPSALPSSVSLVTAAETEWTGGGSVATSGNTLTVQMKNAVATVSVAGMGRGSSG